MSENEVGRKRVVIAVCEAINQFNSGAGNKVEILETIGLPISAQALFGFRKEDELRIKVAERKVSVKSLGMRRKLRAKRKSKGETKTTYFKEKTRKRKAKVQKQPIPLSSNENRDAESKADSEDDIPLSNLLQMKITFVSDLNVQMITSRK